MKKNIQLKKIVSMILSGSLVISSAITSYAAGTKQNSVISSFETFADFVKTGEYALPGGWKTAISPENAQAWRWGVATDETNGMKNLKLHANGNNEVPQIVRGFEQVIKSGKVHVSFDALVDDQLVFYTMEADNGDNPNDTYTPNGQGAYLKPSLFITKGESGTSLAFEKNWTSSTVEGEKIDGITNDEWHKYDFYFDLDGKKLYGYCDGVKLGSEKDFNIGLKCIAIGGTSYNIDNVRINHFLNENNEDDSITAATEVHNKDNNLYVNVAFSEFVNITDRLPKYTLKNALTGETVAIENAISKSSVSGYDFTFENLDAGEYEISFEQNAIKGEITNSYLLKPIRFFAAGTAKDGSDRFYYANENFDDYKGGMPAGWQRGINYYETAQGSTELNHHIESEKRDSGSALKLSYTTEGQADDNSLAYRFNNDIYSGKFTIEFDVKVEEATDWTVGLLTAAEFEGPEWNSTGAATSDWGGSYQDLKKRMNNSRIMVRQNYTDGMYATPDGSWWTAGDTGLKPEKDKWTTVKIDVDLNNSTYTFYQNGEKKNTYEYSSDRYAKRVLKNANGEVKYMHGISAIRFAQTNPSAPLWIDNVKVYKDKSYNAYDTFDNTTKDKQLAQQMNWYSFYSFIYNDISQQDNLYTYGEDGKGETGGGLKLNLVRAAYGREQDAIYRFDRPIKAGKSFDVDFDIKSSAEYPLLDFSLVDKDDLYKTAINHDYGDNWQNLWLRNKVFGIGKDTDKTKIQLWSRNEDSTPNPVYATDDNGYITMQPNEWYHIKFTVNNSDTATDFVITVTDKDGNQRTAYHYNVTGGADMRTQDMYALGVINPVAGWGADDAGGFVGTIDNLTVKEHESFPQGNIVAINNVGFDDSVTPISTIQDGVQTIPQGKYIEVKFNTPIDSQESAAQTIKAYYADTIDTIDNRHVISTTVTLSEDKTTAYVTFNGAEANRNIVLEIGNKIKFANSYLTSVNTTSKTFKFSELPEQSVVVTDLRFYKYTGARYQSWHAKADGKWVPVTGLLETSTADFDDAAEPTHTEKGGFKLVIEGYNPGVATKLFIAAADYSTDEDGKIELKNVPINQVIDVASGAFKQEILFSDDMITKDESGNATINITGNTLRAYAWEYPSARPTVDSEEIK